MLLLAAVVQAIVLYVITDVTVVKINYFSVQNLAEISSCPVLSTRVKSWIVKENLYPMLFTSNFVALHL